MTLTLEKPKTGEIPSQSPRDFHWTVDALLGIEGQERV